MCKNKMYHHPTAVVETARFKLTKDIEDWDILILFNLEGF